MKTNIYFTSDWHIGHANVLAFDQRPFKDLSHMHRVLINNYNSTVGPNDVCYFLGDMGMKANETLFNVIMELHGTKVLVLGNHDKGATVMYNMGFDVVLFGAVLMIAGERVTLSHCPLKGVFREDASHIASHKQGDNWHGESRLGHMYSFADEGQFHLQGHIHSGPHTYGKTKERTLGRQMDVGVAANNYRPVSLSEVESWITRTKQQEIGGEKK